MFKRKSAREQHSADSQFGFGKPVFQPSTTALSAAPVIQTKLKVGEPNDKFEQEADRVADEVMRMSENLVISKEGQALLKRNSNDLPLIQRPRISGFNRLVAARFEFPTQSAFLQGQEMPTARSADTSRIQRLCPECEDEVCRQPVEGQEGKLRRQPMAEEEEEDILQTKEDTSRTPEVTPDLESCILALKDNGQPLPDSVRAFFEPRFGYDFSHVRVHTDENAETSARAINAQAYTVGNDIVFGPGRFDSNTTEGRRLLAHELTHVVQQSAGHSPIAVARQPEKVPPKAPKCHTGCAGHWGQDTTCSKFGFQLGAHEREPQFLIEVVGKKLKKLKLTPCCNSWPFSVEEFARNKLGLDGVASCKWNHEKEIATVSAGEREPVKVLCSDTICEDPKKCNPTFGETSDSKACSKGTFSKEVIELSPKAMEKLSGSQVATLLVNVCYSGTKQDLCPHSGPGKDRFPEIEHCLTEGCTPPAGTPKLRDTGWPRS